jgi:hypothetical protein
MLNLNLITVVRLFSGLNTHAHTTKMKKTLFHSEMQLLNFTQTQNEKQTNWAEQLVQLKQND